VPYFSLLGALGGFGAAIMLNVISTWQYPLTVGGMPLIPIPTTIVVIFELTMLGMLLATFFGVFIEMISPSQHSRVSPKNQRWVYWNSVCQPAQDG
jgi:hypothetical protein